MESNDQVDVSNCTCKFETVQEDNPLRLKDDIAFGPFRHESFERAPHNSTREYLQKCLT